MTSRGHRRNCFDALRLLAALAVVVGHATENLHTSFLWEQGHGDLWFRDGVTAFFIMSGLMIYRSAERCRADGEPWWQFYRNRALRIMPAIYVYALALLVILPLAGALTWSEASSPQFVVFMGSHFALAPVYHPAIFDDFGVGIVNGSLWTIPVEVSFYVIVPLIVLTAARFGFTRALVGVMAFSALGTGLYLAWGGNAADFMAAKLLMVTFAPYLWFFGLGIIWSRLWPHVSHAGWVAGAAFGLYVVGCAIRTPLDGPAYELVTTIAALPLSYFLVWFGYNGPAVLSRVTDRIGDLSFSTYIWHYLVINLAIEAGARSWGVPGTVTILGVIVVSLGIAALSWWLVEKPALGLKHYSLRAEQAPLTVEETAPTR